MLHRLVQQVAVVGHKHRAQPLRQRARNAKQRHLPPDASRCRCRRRRGLAGVPKVVGAVRAGGRPLHHAQEERLEAALGELHHERDDGGHGGGLDLMHVAGQLRGGHCADVQHTQQEQEDLRQVKNELAYMARVGQEITHK